MGAGSGPGRTHGGWGRDPCHLLRPLTVGTSGVLLGTTRLGPHDIPQGTRRGRTDLDHWCDGNGGLTVTPRRTGQGRGGTGRILRPPGPNHRSRRVTVGTATLGTSSPTERGGTPPDPRWMSIPDTYIGTGPTQTTGESDDQKGFDIGVLLVSLTSSTPCVSKSLNGVQCVGTPRDHPSPPLLYSFPS